MELNVVIRVEDKRFEDVSYSVQYRVEVLYFEVHEHYVVLEVV
jgi:hypothetical protein